MPLSTSKHAALTSIATAGVESRPDLSSPYGDDGFLGGPAGIHGGYAGSMASLHSPTSAYSPGMRSSSAAARVKVNGTASLDGTAPDEIQMQSFQDGLPPPPPVRHSWRRIDGWAEDKYEELYDQLAEGASSNDLNELEHMLDCSLPMDVRESLQIHDGQERGGMPTGIIFGCMLLDCEEIVQEWQQWRAVSHEYFEKARPRSVFASRSFAGAGPSSSPHHAPPAGPLWKQDLMARQDSQPPNAVQKVYAHPGWIPLARDWGGNNLAVDLAPGPAGTWGQVIIFGRDFDCKYVVSRSWASFLATVADDLGGDRWYVDEDSNELRLREFKTTTVEPAYLDILRWRMDQKYGKKPGKRRPARLQPPLKSPLNGSIDAGSPYMSPVSAEFERGRSKQRFPGAAASGPAATSSPRSRHGKSSPLARVAEEAAPPTPAASARSDDGRGSDDDSSILPTPPLDVVQSDKLVEAPTPRFETGRAPNARATTVDSGFEEPGEEQDVADSSLKGLGVDGMDGAGPGGEAGALRNVQL